MRSHFNAPGGDAARMTLWIVLALAAGLALNAAGLARALGALP